MDTIEILKAVNEKCLLKYNKSEISERLGIARVNYYKAIDTGKITLDRLLKFIDLAEVTPAQLFCEIEGKHMIDQNMLELTYEIEKLKLSNDYLERMLSMCNEDKNNLLKQIKK